ncbi:hypothetical protein ACOBQB_33190 [Streptomyces sp. G5(2025)]|uniref:hypothetical protein n=1 Tax=Streptomyces sp. G5(2025) TaxID=3406628 RepID=UPI003C1A447E
MRAAVVTTLLAVALAGCGIRSTEVPTDFGPAPSRVPCVMSGSSIATQSGSGASAQVFLVCAAQLVTVDRTVRVAEGKAAEAATDRVAIAQALLDELATPPSESEKDAGFATDVRGGTTVSGPGEGDPRGALRLSTPPEELSAFALAQIVCTLADSATDRTVLMGGPADAPLRRYACTQEVRSRPGTVAPPTKTVKPGK